MLRNAVWDLMALDSSMMNAMVHFNATALLSTAHTTGQIFLGGGAIWALWDL